MVTLSIFYSTRQNNVSVPRRFFIKDVILSVDRYNHALTHLKYPLKLNICLTRFSLLQMCLTC